MTREVHLELLLGRRVLDADGKSAGRIEEVVADRDGLECIVREFHLGSDAIMERLSVPILAPFGRRRRGRKVRWDQMDLSDPERPRVHCLRDELAAL